MEEDRVKHLVLDHPNGCRRSRRRRHAEAHGLDAGFSPFHSEKRNYQRGVANNRFLSARIVCVDVNLFSFGEPRWKRKCFG